MNNRNLHEITALSFEKYMLLKGWHRDYQFNNKRLMVFEHETDRIAIPGSETFPDFYDKVENVLFTLEMFFDEDIDEIVKDIITSYYDRLEFRIQSDYTTNGKLPLGYAAECIDGLKNLILYSSCAEQKIQPVCLTPPKKSRELINNFKLAQTEIGSFIINIDTEVVSENEEQIDFDLAPVDVPTEHKIVQRIFTGISQINDVTEDKMSVSKLVQDAYFTGITANMCDALLKLKADEVKIDAVVRYASALTKKTGVVEKVVLSNKHFHVMKEISEKYRTVAIYEDITLHGLVGEMKKDKVRNNEQREIVLITILDGKYKKVRIELSEEDYRLANKAHMENREIDITGDLDMANPRKCVLIKPKDLKIR